jgi:hypothetical protein
MAVSKRIKSKSSQRIHKFPMAKGKIIAEVELSISPDYNIIEIVFDDKTSLCFNLEPRVQIAPELVSWKSGKLQTHQRLATCSQRLTIFPNRTRWKAGFLLAVFVVSQWPSYKKFIQARTPEITKASFVNRNWPISLEFVNRLGLLNEVTILNPSPINETLFAVSDLRPLISDEERIWAKIILRWTPSLAGWNHSRVSHNFAIKGVCWRERQIIGVIATVWVMIEAHYFGRSFSPVLELNRESHGFGCNSGHVPRISNGFNFNEEPRPFCIDDGSCIEQRSFRAVSCGVCVGSGFFNHYLRLVVSRLHETNLVRDSVITTLSGYYLLSGIMGLQLHYVGLPAYFFRHSSSNANIYRSDDRKSKRDDVLHPLRNREVSISRLVCGIVIFFVGCPVFCVIAGWNICSKKYLYGGIFAVVGVALGISGLALVLSMP